jgi:pilus assembly protein CpaE
MPELRVAIVAADGDQRAVLQVLVDSTSVARASFSATSYPVAATDPIVRRIQSTNPDVILVDIPSDSSSLALRTIEVLQEEIPAAAMFAVGSMNQPQVIVNAMRAGAKEFISRPTTTTDLLEAFVRLTAAQRKVQKEEVRGKVFTVVNAKGGNGATTIAVNLALALQAAHGNVALVDIAPLGHTALHMNLKPLFSVSDAVRNLAPAGQFPAGKFCDPAQGGLQLLAGPSTPELAEPSPRSLPAFSTCWWGTYRYIVVDTSTRIDATTRLVGNLSETVLLVAHTDVASLWSAARIQQFLRRGWRAGASATGA